MAHLYLNPHIWYLNMYILAVILLVSVWTLWVPLLPWYRKMLQHKVIGIIHSGHRMIQGRRHLGILFWSSLRKKWSQNGSTPGAISCNSLFYHYPWVIGSEELGPHQGSIMQKAIRIENKLSGLHIKKIDYLDFQNIYHNWAPVTIIVQVSLRCHTIWIQIEVI